jgi:GT2 family glycosyltransferase
VAIIAADGAALGDAIAAVEAQVYGPQRRFVIGGDAAVRRITEEAGFVWTASWQEFLNELERETYVWFLRESARPRPDALEALVGDAVRTDASIAGSKVLAADDPGQLLAVGVSTDVFNVPFRGLDEGEVDQGQYDVVRDVAAVNGISILVRRDLAQGLHGIDRRLTVATAAIDLCQRARLRGGRVIVSPSSEVLVPRRDVEEPAWREEAGRIRAMLKVYSLLTLLWALPGVMLIGLLEAIVVPFLGRWTLFAWLRAWAWSAMLLPDTISRRRRARRGRVVGDEELFRYQIRGSARLRMLGTEIATKVRTRWPEGRFDLAELGREVSRPAFVAGAAAILFVLAATRVVWQDGLPAGGFALLPSADAAGTLNAYAGGWNPAGLGSPEPLRPLVGLVAAVQFLLFDRPALTVAVLTVAAFFLGVLGMARLLRGFGFESFTGYLAGVVLMGSQATRALGAMTDWGSLLALALVPWVLRTALRARRPGWRSRIGRVAALGAITGLAAMASPAVLVIPAAALLLWVVFGDVRAWPAVPSAVLGAVAAFPLLLPWAGTADLDAFVSAGEGAFWEPWPVLAGAALIAALGTIAAGAGRTARVAAWGGLLGAGGAALARSGEAGWGRAAESAGLILAALGIALVVGAALQVMTELVSMEGIRRAIGFTAVVAALPILAATAALGVPGRAGLPAAVLDDALGFTTAQQDDPAGSRVLLVGDPAVLPGESRTYLGAGYRVTSAPRPTLDEAWLGAPRLGDVALEDALEAIVAGDVLRAGETLQPFGIRWVVALSDSPFTPFFDGQLDLIELGGVGVPAYRNELPARRAVADDGTAWVWTGAGYEGTAAPGTRVLLAENGDSRWGPEPWSQDSWANTVAGFSGTATLAPDPGLRRLAMAAPLIFVALAAIGMWGRRGGRER